MENISGELPPSPQVPALVKKSPTNQIGNRLLSAGIIGIILTALYFLMSRSCDMWEHSCTLFEAELHIQIVIAQTIYFIVTSLLLFFSGIWIRNGNRKGAYLFLGALSIFIISVALPANLFLPVYNSGPLRTLFMHAFETAFMGSVFLVGIPIVGTLIFYIEILASVLQFGRLVEPLGLPSFFKKLWLFSVLFLLLCLATSEVYRHEVLSSQSTFPTVNTEDKALNRIEQENIIEQYKNINNTFSSYVTVDHTDEIYGSDGYFLLIFSYKETDIKTYLRAYDSAIHGESGKGVLASLPGKKVSVIIPPLNMFVMDVEQNKGKYYLGYVFDGNIDIQQSIGTFSSILVPSSNPLITPETNQKNLQFIDHYPTKTSELLSTDIRHVYTQERQKKLCKSLAEPREVVSIGYAPAAASMSDGYYVVLSGLPDTQILITSPANLLQNSHNISSSEIEEGLVWLKSVVKKYNAKVEVRGLCDVAPEGFYPFYSESIYEHSVYGTDYLIPITERFFVDQVYMPSVNSQQVQVWGQLRRQGWNP